MFSNNLQKNLVIKIPNYPRRKEKHHLTMQRTLLKEASLLEQCNVVGTKYVPMQYCYDKDGKFVIRECVDGKCMSEVVSSLENDKIEILNDFIEMTEELFYVFHEQLGVVIKDLKPRNIVVTETNNQKQYKLIDLGSCLKEENIPLKRRKENMPKLGVGQYLHWPPELLLERFDLCDRSLDYFAFGVTCYNIITGEYPFTNTERDVEKVYNVYNEEYEMAITKLKDVAVSLNINENFINFIIQCLNPDYSERPRKWVNENIMLKKKEKK